MFWNWSGRSGNFIDAFGISEVRRIDSCPRICSSMLPGTGDVHAVPVLVPGGTGVVGLEISSIHLASQKSGESIPGLGFALACSLGEGIMLYLLWSKNLKTDQKSTQFRRK